MVAVMVQGGGLRGGGGNQLAVQVVQQGIRQFGRAQSRAEIAGEHGRSGDIAFILFFRKKAGGEGNRGRRGRAGGCGRLFRLHDRGGGRFLNGRFLVGGAGSGTDQPGNQTGADQESFHGADSYSFIPAWQSNFRFIPFLQRVKEGRAWKNLPQGGIFISGRSFLPGDGGNGECGAPALFGFDWCCE